MSGQSSSAAPPHVEPAVFIASLTDYVNGILHGRWVSARQAVEELAAAVTEVLATSPWAARTGEPAEEWIILDHEGFVGATPDPHEALDDVTRLAEARDAGERRW